MLKQYIQDKQAEQTFPDLSHHFSWRCCIVQHLGLRVPWNHRHQILRISNSLLYDNVTFEYTDMRSFGLLLPNS